MTREEIIQGLMFTVDMFLFDSTTGETYTEPQNDMDKTTIDACRGAIELLEQESVLDKIRAEIVQGHCVINNDYDRGFNYGLYVAIQIIDKYKTESEDN